MAVTVSIYDHTANLLQSATLAAADTYKVKLLNNSAVFTAANTTIAQVDNSGAYEVSGNGWTSGGETLASVAITVTGTNDSMFDAADISVTASGGAIGPAYKALLYNSTDSKPLAFIDFGGAKTADDGTPFKINWNASGIFRVIVT